MKLQVNRGNTAKRIVSRIRSIIRNYGGSHSSSTEYSLVEYSDETSHTTQAGWCNPYVAKQQHDAYKRLIHEMHIGKPRQDLLIAAQAVQLTGIKTPKILE